MSGLVDILAAMYVTCHKFMILCLDFSKSCNDFSFQKVHIFKTEIIKTTEKEPYKWVGVMIGSLFTTYWA